MIFSRSTHSPIHLNFQHATYPSFLFCTYYFTFPYNIYSYIASNSACYALIVSIYLFISSCALLASSLPCSVPFHNIPLLPLPVIFLTSLPDIISSPYLTLPHLYPILTFLLYSPYLISSYLTLSHLILSYLILSYLILS